MYQQRRPGNPEIITTDSEPHEINNRNGETIPDTEVDTLRVRQGFQLIQFRRTSIFLVMKINVIYLFSNQVRAGV